MLRDFGVDSEGVIYADSSAALAITKRKGAGSMRHVNVNCLWIQERQNEKDLEPRKVLGTENPADLMTKHLARQPLDKCMLQLNQHRTSGRASAGLDVQGKNKASADPVSTPSGETWTAERQKERNPDVDSSSGRIARSPSHSRTLNHGTTDKLVENDLTSRT